jgi:preprotein translocase subunit SecA
LKNEIIERKKETEKLTDEKLKEEFSFYRNEIKKEENYKKKIKLLDKYLAPVFSLVREVIQRKMGLLLFPTQIFGAIVLHNSNIAQMNTGEGKTLTAFLPTCLNSLMERTVFVITVNEYLAKRDWELAKTILDFFEIKSDVNRSGLTKSEKKKIYDECNVIYTTGSELGFDYLRNNLAVDPDNKMKQDFFYAIIDETDSLLLDEGMNPLIISQKTGGELGKINSLECTIATKVSKILNEEEDYKIEEKEL